MKIAAVATSCVISVICLTGTSLASPGAGPSSRPHGVSHSVKALQNVRPLVPGMRVIKQIMGFRLVPPVVLMPGMKIIHVESASFPETHNMEVLYYLTSNQPAAKLYQEYYQFYGNSGRWLGYSEGPMHHYFYSFLLRVPPARIGAAAFNIWEKMLPGDAKYAGSQRDYKILVQIPIYVPFAYSQKYQQKHHGAVQYPLPVDPAH